MKKPQSERESPPRYVVGVDGCRGGWFFVCFTAVRTVPLPAQLDTPEQERTVLLASVDFGLLRNNSPPALSVLLREATCAYVDMPMGLADGSGITDRRCDRDARALLGRLGGPKSSIFPVPARSAVYATSYEEACVANRAVCDHAVSRQAWYLAPKIRALDQLLRSEPSLADHLFESHPEVCFRTLFSDGAALPGKRSRSGADARLTRIAALFPQAADALRRARQRWNRREVAVDDVLDAFVLALSAWIAAFTWSGSGWTESAGFTHNLVPLEPQIDAVGIAARLAYPSHPCGTGAGNPIFVTSAPRSQPPTAVHVDTLLL